MDTEIQKKDKSVKILVSILILLVIAGLGTVIYLTFFNDSKPKDEDKEQVEVTVRDLTQDEIKQVNEAFEEKSDDNNTLVVPDITKFFLSDYEKNDEMNMELFIRYLIRESYLDPEDDKEEIDHLNEMFDQDFYNVLNAVPFGRISYDTVEGMLQKHMGLSIDDMKNMEGVIYSDEYESFYSFASDYMFGYFLCTSGKINGDIITLYGTSNLASENAEAVLTLKKVSDEYHIQSYVLENK